MKNSLKKNIAVLLLPAFVIFQSFSFGSFALFTIVLIVIFAIMLVRASKNSAPQQDDSIETKLKESISKARRIIFRAQNDIAKFQLLANQAISEALGDLVNKYNTDELYKKFDKIKEDFKNELEEHQWEKLEEIIKGYLAQIELKKHEISAAENIKEKYESLLEQIKHAKKKEKKAQAIEKHSQRLEEISQNTETTKTLIEESLNFDSLKQEVEQKTLYLEELEKLQAQLEDKKIMVDAGTYGEELKKIINNLED